MPVGKPTRNYSALGSSYQPKSRALEDPCTPGQINKLMAMLKHAGELKKVPHSNDWDEYRDACEDEAIAWVKDKLGMRVLVLSELTQGQIGRCFDLLK